MVAVRKHARKSPEFARAFGTPGHMLPKTHHGACHDRGGTMRGRSAFVAACGLSSVAAFSPTAPTTTHLRAAGTSIARATAIQLQDKAEVRRAREQ